MSILKAMMDNTIEEITGPIDPWTYWKEELKNEFPNQYDYSGTTKTLIQIVSEVPTNSIVKVYNTSLAIPNTRHGSYKKIAFIGHPKNTFWATPRSGSESLFDYEKLILCHINLRYAGGTSTSGIGRWLYNSTGGTEHVYNYCRFFKAGKFSVVDYISSVVEANIYLNHCLFGTLSTGISAITNRAKIHVTNSVLRIQNVSNHTLGNLGIVNTVNTSLFASGSSYVMQNGINLSALTASSGFNIGTGLPAATGWETNLGYLTEISESLWKNKGTGSNVDGSRAHIGLYGGIGAWDNLIDP